MIEQLLLTEEEQARVLNCSRRFLRDLRRKRLVPFVRVGRNWIRYNPVMVAAAMEKLTIKARV